MKERSTIAVVTTSFPIAGDGSEAAGGFVADLVETLAEHVDVRVVAPGPSTESQRFSQGIEVFRFKAPTAPLSTLKPWRPDHLITILRVLRSGQKALNKALMGREVLHILALWALPSGHWARNAGKKTGIPYSVWTLGSDVWNLGRIPVIRKYLGGILTDADYCFSDGFKLARDTEAIGKRSVLFLPSTRRLQTDRIETVRDTPPYRLIFLGRWHPNKGIDLLLEALWLLDAEDWKRIEAVSIFGGGPMKREVQHGVSRLQQAGRPIELSSYLSKTKAEDAIARADYLLIPSRIESIPVVFSDAIQLGTPVIAMPTGDLPSLVGAGCGILSNSIDAESYASAIRQALRVSAGKFCDQLSETAGLFSMQSSVIPKLLEAIDGD